jgi:branched-chain amino acid transport system substrate-binding protein
VSPPAAFCGRLPRPAWPRSVPVGAGGAKPRADDREPRAGRPWSLPLCCALALLAGALALSGCGSGSHRSPRAVPAAATASTPTSVPTPAPIPVGTICTCSGPLAGALEVMRAWAKSVNAAGGIGGHPVELFTADDGGSAARSLAEVEQLVAVDHVVAIVGETSAETAAWASYVAAQRIPVIGGMSYAPPAATSPDFFPSGAPLALQVVGAAALAREAGARDLGVVACAGAGSCEQLVTLADGAAALEGVAKVTRVQPSSSDAADIRTCRALHAAGVDALLLTSRAAGTLRLLAACFRAGFAPLVTSYISALPKRWLDRAQLDGTLIAAPYADPADPTSPGLQQFRAVLARYVPTLLTARRFSYQLVGPWAGGLLFAAAARAAGARQALTATGIRKGLYALHGETLGGVAPPLQFTPGKAALVPCYFEAELSAGALEPLNDNKPRCLSPDQASALLKAVSP